MKNLFSAARLKFTLFYLSILLFISISFSIVVYRISSPNLEGLSRRQIQFLLNQIEEIPRDKFRPPTDMEVRDFIADTRLEIKSDLFVANMLILIFGGLASSYLAKKTLQPIEKAHETMKKFTSNASHELRTPMAAIKLSSEIALANPDLDIEEARSTLASNLEEIDKIHILSDKLLKSSSYQNTPSLKIEQVRVTELIRKSVKSVQPQATARCVKVNILGETSKNISIQTDNQKIQGILVILLDNAIKYSRNIPDAKVNISFYSSKNSAIFKISDNGQGIDKSSLDKIFNRFYRADTSRTNKTGHSYGLGLAIAKEDALLIGADIRVKSKVGIGSDFKVIIPKITSGNRKTIDPKSINMV